MPVDTQARHELHKRAEEVLGPEPAGTLMELLPPFDWSEVAMKSDLRELEARLGERIEKSAASTTRTVVFSVVSLTVTMMGANIALVSALR